MTSRSDGLSELHPCDVHHDSHPCSAGTSRSDEELLYEDWDMWLRLALKWRFLFMPEALARYRVVGTSMARTALMTASPARRQDQCDPRPQVSVVGPALARPRAALEEEAGRPVLQPPGVWGCFSGKASVSRLSLDRQQAAGVRSQPSRRLGCGAKDTDRFRRLLGRGMR